ncbi:MAG: transposase [Verrucomicrobia bacterium]|nr:transposase [Verrucomicrobiota bacterium]MBS0647138.1 transposase [Verrucomicrobiota bacterium]
MNFARESLIAALSRGKLLSPMCFQGTCNTGLFNTWLEKMVVPQLQPGQVLILDNASFHQSEESKKLVEAAGCKLMFLPPYSSDLNPIEKCWTNIKAKVRELLPKFTEALDAAILSM